MTDERLQELLDAAYQEAWRHSRRGAIPEDEARACARVGVFQALSRKPDLGHPRYAGYVCLTVRGEISDWLQSIGCPIRRRDKHRRPIFESLNEPIMFDGEQVVERIDRLESEEPSPEELTARRHDRERLMYAIQSLPTNHRRVIQLRLRDVSDAGAARVIGVTRQRASQIKHEAIEMLREALIPEEREAA